MPPNGFSAALKMLRERRNLSGRELSLIAKIDHAYESRLESGEKTNPSDEAVDKLLRGLKPNERDAQIFRWLAQHPDTSSDWVVYMLDEPTGTLEEFTVGAVMVNRGKVPTPEKTLERVRKALAEDEE